VQGRIAAAAGSCGRDPGEITLIAVTKTWPASDVARLSEMGVVDFAENRDAEAAAKVAECAAAGLSGLVWHFVGQVQTNKARSVAEHVDVVQSVDRERLVDALAAACERAGRSIDVLVQVDLDPAAAQAGFRGRGGALPEAVPGLCAAVAVAPGLRLRGLMAVAPLGEDPDPAFARLARCAASVRVAHPAANWISAGMSGDLEAAIAHGATHVRVGSGLLGTRSISR
jgi:pyridoxal phosphate enzyme (YggS family)